MRESIHLPAAVRRPLNLHPSAGKGAASHNRYRGVSVSLHNAHAECVMERIKRAVSSKFHGGIPNPDDDLFGAVWLNPFAKHRGTVLSNRPFRSGVKNLRSFNE